MDEAMSSNFNVHIIELSPMSTVIISAHFTMHPSGRIFPFPFNLD
jgi:hypothetical protein